jgi:hypothetical protein
MNCRCYVVFVGGNRSLKVCLPPACACPHTDRCSTQAGRDESSASGRDLYCSRLQTALIHDEGKVSFRSLKGFYRLAQGTALTFTHNFFTSDLKTLRKGAIAQNKVGGILPAGRMATGELNLRERFAASKEACPERSQRSLS